MSELLDGAFFFFSVFVVDLVVLLLENLRPGWSQMNAHRLCYRLFSPTAGRPILGLGSVDGRDGILLRGR